MPHRTSGRKPARVRPPRPALGTRVTPPAPGKPKPRATIASGPRGKPKLPARGQPRPKPFDITLPSGFPLPPSITRRKPAPKKRGDLTPPPVIRPKSKPAPGKPKPRVKLVPKQQPTAKDALRLKQQSDKILRDVVAGKGTKTSKDALVLLQRSKALLKKIASSK